MCTRFAVSDAFLLYYASVMCPLHIYVYTLSHVDKSVDPFVIEKVTLSPDPPVKGQDLTLDVSYFLGEMLHRSLAVCTRSNTYRTRIHTHETRVVLCLNTIHSPPRGGGDWWGGQGGDQVWCHPRLQSVF